MSGLHAAPQEDEAVTASYLVNLGARPDDAEFMLRGKFRTVIERCPLRRLSNLLREERIDRVALLKVDVEKSELEVLAGIDDEHWPHIDRAIV
jgi:FkbM family methyltransferase